MIERLIFSFLILKQELFCLHHFFSLCMCVHLTQRSIYEAFFFLGTGRIREIRIPMVMSIILGFILCGMLILVLFLFLTISLVISLP